MKPTNKTGKQLARGIAAIIILSACLVVTTAALVFATVRVNENFFHTGKIELDLNGGKPVITEADGYLFEPGMTVVRPFYVKNVGTGDAWYKLYFENVSGGLADILDITILDGSTVLYSGTANELSEANVEIAEGVLLVGERKDLTITFHYPESGGNAGQGEDLLFDFCAKAVQTKNNPDKNFE